MSTHREWFAEKLLGLGYAKAQLHIETHTPTSSYFSVSQSQFSNPFIEGLYQGYCLAQGEK